MKLVLIKKDGTMDDIILKITKKNVLSLLNKSYTSSGNDSIRLLYTWKYIDSDIHCFGWNEGEAGFENKHDLPPSGLSKFLHTDSSEQLLFGDIFILKMKNGKYVDFEISDYGEFYNISFGGFDNCDSDNDESEDSNELQENTDDEEFIVKDINENEDEEWNISEEEDMYSSDEDSELDEDLSTY
tara:strand:- start:1478 stop:2032 length:555 start_codon:yes stop_codon:yes gene_type:complete